MRCTVGWMRVGELRRMTAMMWAEDTRLYPDDFIIIIEDIGLRAAPGENKTVNTFRVLTHNGVDWAWADYLLQRSERA